MFNGRAMSITGVDKAELWEGGCIIPLDDRGRYRGGGACHQAAQKDEHELEEKHVELHREERDCVITCLYRRGVGRWL